MGTVKYSGPVASFHCPTEATIRSLKVHFSPKQLGEGTPSPENVREIEGWDGVMVHNDVEYILIPAEYQRVEYIYNTGTTEWIDTGIVPYTNTKAQIKVMNLRTTGDVIFGYYNNDDRTDWRVFNFNQKFYFNCPDNSVPTASGRRFTGVPDWKQDAIYELELGNWYAKDLITNTNLFEDTTREIQGTNTITLNCYQTSNSVKCSSNRWYYVKIYDSNSLVRDMYPCRRKFDNKPGMYDTVSGEFFINQGTGEFICGPDIGETVEYEFGVLGKNKFPASDGTTSNIFLSANTTYTFSATSPSTGYFRGWYEDETDTGLIWINAGVDGDRRWKTYTPERNIIKGTFYVGTGMSECQIELGSTATTYEPYDPNKTVYGGWVDLISGEVCEEYGFLTESSGGTLASIVDRNDGYYSIIFNFDTDKRPYSSSGSLCNILNYNSTLTAQNNEYAFYYYLNQQAWKAECRIYSATPLTTVDEAKTYLNQLGFKLAYKIPTPITYQLAPTSMQTFLSHNNVWSNADYVEVEYDLHETQNILARKQFIVANQPHIVKPAAAPLQNFVTDMAALLKECKVYFGPVQDTSNGAPSPDNICPISGWTEVEVTRCGKNLFSSTKIQTGKYVTWSNSEVEHVSYNCSDYIEIKPDTYYTVTIPKYTAATAAGQLFLSDTLQPLLHKALKGYTKIGSTDDEGAYYTCLSPTNAKYLRISWANHIGDNCQIEEGQIRTPYESYTGTTIPITFPSEAGTIYGGYVDLIKGEMVAEWYKIVADGVNIKANSSYMTDNYIAAGIVYLTPNGMSSTNVKYANNVLCNIIPVYSQNYLSNHRDEVSYPYASATNAGQQYIVFYLANRADYPEVTDETSCKNFVNAWLQEHPATLVYELRTPITHQIDPQTLKTIRGTNNVWSNAGDITLSYWKH